MKDVTNGVQVEFRVTGDNPGGGHSKPLAFSDPGDRVAMRNGLPIITWPALIELSLASGMTAAGRLKELAVVQELIRTSDLSLDLSQRLYPDVLEKFVELWQALHDCGGET